MQPTDLTLPGILSFFLISVIIFAFKNPKGYKKIQNALVIVVALIYVAFLGINIYKDYLLSNFDGKIIDNSIIKYLYSFEGDLVFYSACAFLLYVGIILLERLNTLNDKN